MGSRVLRGFLASAIPITLGAGFYIFVRAREAWFVAHALRLPVIGSSLRTLRTSMVVPARSLPSIVDDVAPDFLWALAVGGMLCAFNGERRSRALWAALGLTSVVGYELAQRWHLVPGTFDPKDLVAQVIGFALGCLGAGHGIRTRDIQLGEVGVITPRG